MTELRMAVCDDLEEERVQLARMARSYAQRRGLSMELRLFASGNELLDAARRPDFCHVLFLTSSCPGLSGLDAAGSSGPAGCMASIVFATTSQDYGVMSFDVQAADYLVKPFRQEDVDRTLDWCPGAHARVPAGPVRLCPGEWRNSPDLHLLHRGAGPPVPHPHQPPDPGGPPRPGRPGERHRQPGIFSAATAAF